MGTHERSRIISGRQPQPCREYLAALAAVLDIDYAPFPDARERLRLALASLSRALDSNDLLVLSAEATALRGVTGRK